MRQNVLTEGHITALCKKRKREREKRDPYDGLRPWSAITHGVGALLAILATIYLVEQSLIRGSVLDVGVFLVYGLSMIGLYTASTLYHSLHTSVAGRIMLRKCDHCSIYLLIAGSYTPVCFTVLQRDGGIPLVTVIWILAAAGIGLSIVRLDIPRWLTSGIYLGMGWMALVAVAPLTRLMTPTNLFLLVLGGVFYSVGGMIYAVKWPGRHCPNFGCHEIFHLFILLGSVCHFIMMTQLLPQG